MSKFTCIQQKSGLHCWLLSRAARENLVWLALPQSPLSRQHWDLGALPRNKDGCRPIKPTSLFKGIDEMLSRLGTT